MSKFPKEVITLRLTPQTADCLQAILHQLVTDKRVNVKQPPAVIEGARKVYDRLCTKIANQ